MGSQEEKGKCFQSCALPLTADVGSEKGTQETFPNRNTFGPKRDRHFSTTKTCLFICRGCRVSYHPTYILGVPHPHVNGAPRTPNTALLALQGQGVDLTQPRRSGPPQARVTILAHPGSHAVNIYLKVGPVD